ncbi:MAG: EH signature domain-containing protein [Calothrix sp. MO_167.B12]|nr:EH signature domain-containing protein [Calothrix sp. MO_167.B12]
MTFEFPIPSQQDSKEYLPDKLIALQKKLPNLQIPLPTVDRVIQSIKQGNAEKITKLEWIYCINVKGKWDGKNFHISRKTSELIWETAINNVWLRHILLWRLVLQDIETQENSLSESITTSFDVLANSLEMSNLLVIKVVQAIVSKDSGSKLAEIACQQNLSYLEFIETIGNDLPVWVPKLKLFPEYISPYFSSLSFINQQKVSWFLRCLNEMSLEQQVNAVNHLLTHISNNIVIQHPQIIDWVRQNYHSGDKWYRLSEAARQKLREWIGAVNYGDFQKLVDLILHRLDLQNWEDRQLRSRKKFWANYSNRFQRIRILLPQSSLKAIGNRFNGDVDILENDGSDPTEICIFDFGEWLVAEFFRGRGSETRLFTNNSTNQQLLFGQSKLSVKQIRCLGGDRHDHTFLWQYFCRQWLSNQGIVLNPGTKPYQIPTEQELQEREYKLKRWKSEIEQLEREAKEYCKKVYFCNV